MHFALEPSSSDFPRMVPYYCLTPIIQVTMCCCGSVNLKSWTKSVKSFLFFCKLAKTFSGRRKKYHGNNILRNLCFIIKEESCFYLIISANSLVTYSSFDLPIFFLTALIKYRHLSAKYSTLISSLEGENNYWYVCVDNVFFSLSIP